MSSLHIGAMTNKELAEWFGVTESTMKSTKKKKLKELERYAEFEPVRGKVIITRILVPGKYVKQKSKGYQIVEEHFDDIWSETGLDTCSNVAKKIFEKYEKDLTVKEGTVYTYTRFVRNDFYGIPNVKDGKKGKCEYVWCKKISEGCYEPLTKEEEKIKNNLVKKWFGDTTDKQLMVEYMVQSGEISKEEAWEALREITGVSEDKFLMFLNDLQAELGCQVVKGTMIEKSTWSKEN